jgi:hypothetical protein
VLFQPGEFVALFRFVGALDHDEEVLRQRLLDGWFLARLCAQQLFDPNPPCPKCGERAFLIEAGCTSRIYSPRDAGPDWPIDWDALKADRESDDTDDA